MSQTTQAVLGSWSFDLKLALGVVISLVLYWRGWIVLHQTLPGRFPAWRLGAFAGGMAVLWLAVASPLDAFSGLLLSAHMVQHLLLLSVAPPLLLLGAPLLPLLRGLPRKIARDGLSPFLIWPRLRRFGHALTNPFCCWVIMAATLALWHLPSAFDLALRSPGWHKVEHACFLGASILFWWPVLCPFPGKPQWPAWSIPIYLLATDLFNTILCAIFTFSDRVLYPPYLEVPRLFGTTALSDQTCAGVIMWVPGSLVFLIPAAAIAIRYLSGGQSLVRLGKAPPAPVYFRPPVAPRSRFDLLKVPLIGPFLRARSGRRFLQAVLLLVAAAVVVDGLFGPPVSSMNLAGVLPWIYWRAFAIIALLAAGNLFCMACPFMLVRDLGRRLGLPQRSWPQALRSKWFAVVLLVSFFWCYEVFSLWDKPIWTAGLIINYFIAAFVIDSLFRGASFCKYVCPIGQFQFVASLVSPLEVKVRQPDICARCKTHDCLRGNEHQRGCETYLYLPRKAGNMDCTFCLDCVRACPHDNVGVSVSPPGMSVVPDLVRSSVGRFSRRLDIAALVLVFVFAAFANPAFMTVPVVSFEENLAARLGLESPLAATGVLLLLALLAVPASLALLAARASQATNLVSATRRELVCRFSVALVPLGAAMWAGHFLFHFSVGWDSAWVATQHVATALGWHLPASTVEESGSPLLSAHGIHVLQTLLLDAGFLLALYLLWRIALDYAPRPRDAARLILPWAAIATVLYAAGVWILLQPMQMRGMSIVASTL